MGNSAVTGATTEALPPATMAWKKKILPTPPRMPVKKAQKTPMARPSRFSCARAPVHRPRHEDQQRRQAGGVEQLVYVGVHARGGDLRHQSPRAPQHDGDERPQQPPGFHWFWTE